MRHSVTFPPGHSASFAAPGSLTSQLEKKYVRCLGKICIVQSGGKLFAPSSFTKFLEIKSDRVQSKIQVQLCKDDIRVSPDLEDLGVEESCLLLGAQQLQPAELAWGTEHENDWIPSLLAYREYD